MPCPPIKSPRCYAWRPLKTNPGTFGKIFNVKRLSQSGPTTIFSLCLEPEIFEANVLAQTVFMLKEEPLGLIWLN